MLSIMKLITTIKTNIYKEEEEEEQEQQYKKEEYGPDLEAGEGTYIDTTNRINDTTNDTTRTIYTIYTINTINKYEYNDYDLEIGGNSFY